MHISDWSSDVCSSDLIEAQRRLGQTDDLLDYFDRRQGGASLGGPAGPRIGRTLDDAAVQLGPLPAMIADRARLRVMLASVARTFHVGPLADCFFDPATALCLKRVTTPDPAQPLTALRSEEHTSELQSLMRISYAVFCWKKKKRKNKSHK